MASITSPCILWSNSSTTSPFIMACTVSSMVCTMVVSPEGNSCVCTKAKKSEETLWLIAASIRTGCISGTKILSCTTALSVIPSRYNSTALQGTASPIRNRRTIKSLQRKKYCSTQAMFCSKSVLILFSSLLMIGLAVSNRSFFVVFFVVFFIVTPPYDGC